jgi:hypothetical protein
MRLCNAQTAGAYEEPPALASLFAVCAVVASVRPAAAPERRLFAVCAAVVSALPAVVPERRPYGGCAAGACGEASAPEVVTAADTVSCAQLLGCLLALAVLLCSRGDGLVGL